MPSIHTFRIEIETPDGTLGPADIDISDEPARLADLVPAIHELVNGAVALAIKRAQREGRTLSCKAGCGVCCCQLVPVAPAEVFSMVDRIRSMPAEQRLPILNRFQEIENSLGKTGLLERISVLGETDDNNTVAQVYFEQRHTCPFLAEQSCSIHPWRPIACREYNVTSSPLLCADPFRHKIDTIRLHRRMSAGLAKLGVHVAGLPLGLVPMPLLFDYYETYKEAAARTWPGIDLFRQAMDFVLGKIK
jgi:Fe-S-cluster containining protein